METSELQMLTKRQVCQLLKISLSTLNKWLLDGRLRSVKLCRAVRIRVTELQKFVEESERKESERKETTSNSGAHAPAQETAGTVREA